MANEDTQRGDSKPGLLELVVVELGKKGINIDPKYPDRKLYTPQTRERYSNAVREIFCELDLRPTTDIKSTGLPKTYKELVQYVETDENRGFFTEESESESESVYDDVM